MKLGAGQGVTVYRAFWVFVIGLLLLPVILKKELQEIKLLSYLLFFSVSAFITLMGFQLLTVGG